MQNSTLNKGVVSEPADSLAPKREAYWVEKAGRFERIVASSTETIDDQELSWVQARVTDFVRVQRSLYDRIMRTEIESIEHPSGFEVQRNGTPRNGFLMTAAPSANLMEETAKRVRLEQACLTQISAQKLFVEGAVPLRTHTIDQSVTLDRLENIELPVDRVEAVYRHAFDTLQNVLARRSDQFSVSDATLIYDLDRFRTQRVKWASLTPSGGMLAQEPGKIGDAWIFVVPPGHPMIKTQTAVHSMNVDNSGLNPYLSILPYDMTEKWASMAALHELSHLRDHVLGVESFEGKTRDQYLEGEHRAYSVERALAFAYSDGRLQQTLQTVVSKALQSADPMQALNALVNHELPGISQSLDQCIDPNPPKSQGELGVRQGLYVMLLGFEIARQTAQGNAEQQRHMEKGFIELIYEPTGHLPKK